MVTLVGGANLADWSILMQVPTIDGESLAKVTGAAATTAAVCVDGADSADSATGVNSAGSVVVVGTGGVAVMLQAEVWRWVVGIWLAKVWLWEPAVLQVEARLWALSGRVC